MFLISNISSYFCHPIKYLVKHNLYFSIPMKKFVFILLLALTSNLIFAQQGSPSSLDKRAEYLTDWLSDLLELKIEQKAKVLSVYKNYLQDMVTMLDKHTGNVTQLRNRKDELEQIQQNAIATVLNDAQLAKYKEMNQKRDQ